MNRTQGKSVTQCVRFNEIEPILNMLPIPLMSFFRRNEMKTQVPIETQRKLTPDTFMQLRELQAQRVGTLKAQMRINNQCGALVRRMLGWDPNATEPERKKLVKMADKIVKSIQNGDEIAEEHQEVAENLSAFCMAAKIGRAPFDSYRKVLEKKMKALAVTVPEWEVIGKIQGFGELGFSIILGETGNPANYDNPAKLWKRMGLGVIDGERQRKCLDKEKAIIMGYNPRRRAAMWTIGDSLIKGNKNGYKTLYDEQKQYQIRSHPEMTPIHAHRRAQRFMEKRLLLDIWEAFSDQVVI